MTSELARRCAVNSNYSIRSFARAMGLNSGAVSQILSGKRIPSLRTAQRLVCRMGLPPYEEENFVDSLAEVHRSRGLKRISPVFRSAPQRTPPIDLSLDKFRVISEWYHLAILELTRIPQFKATGKNIAKRLGISPPEAELAIARLKTLGLLQQKKDRWVKTHEQVSTADKEHTAPALKRYQRHILEKALFSLDHDPIEKRNMVGITMAIDPRKITGAKKRIQNFIRDLNEYLETGSPTRVYQLQCSLFPLDVEKETT